MSPATACCRFSARPWRKLTLPNRLVAASFGTALRLAGGRTRAQFLFQSSPTLAHPSPFPTHRAPFAFSPFAHIASPAHRFLYMPPVDSLRIARVPEPFSNILGPALLESFSQRILFFQHTSRVFASQQSRLRFFPYGLLKFSCIRVKMRQPFVVDGKPRKHFPALVELAQRLLIAPRPEICSPEKRLDRRREGVDRYRLFHLRDGFLVPARGENNCSSRTCEHRDHWGSITAPAGIRVPRQASQTQSAP
jgi:hypothetical protein